MIIVQLQDCVLIAKWKLEKTIREIKNEQSKDTGNIGQYKMLHATSCKEYPHSFICKSHGKQEADVQSFLSVEAEISLRKCERTDKRTDGLTGKRTNGRTD